MPRKNATRWFESGIPDKEKNIPTNPKEFEISPENNVPKKDNEQER